MDSVAVTGGDGFIGSHVVEELVRTGMDVRVMVQYNARDSWGWLDHCDPDVAGHFSVVPGDVRDSGSVTELVKGMDAIVHLAALIAIPYSYKAPRSYVETNILGTLNILEAARRQGVHRLVHTSTSEVYGSAQFVPMDETHPLSAQSPYAASKVAADQLSQSYFHSFDVPVTILRPFNTYGRRQSTRALIPTIVTQVLGGLPRVDLGATWPTRDFTHVSETARAFHLALTAVDAPGQVINVGSNFEVSVGQIVEMVGELTGTKTALSIDQERLRPEGSEVNRLWCNNARALSVLGWAPAKPGLEGFRDGLRQTIDWFRQADNASGYRVGDYTL